jgi:hypothetical protein
MARKGKTPKEAKPKKERFKQLKLIKQTYQLTKQVDKFIGLILFAVFFGTTTPIIVIGILTTRSAFAQIISVSLGITIGLMLTVIVFGRRAESAAYAKIEGQPGAAAAILNTLKKGWIVTPAVALTKQQDLVHRVLGPVGVVLVGEGSANRVAQLLQSERVKAQRIAGEVPVTTLIVGMEEGLVPYRKLVKHVKKLGKKISPKEVRQLRSKFGAVASSPLPIPKGPMPKGMRVPRR